MKRPLMGLIAAAAVLAPWLALAQRQPPPHAYVPPAGFVPDSVTAVRIATAVWAPIYGEAQIRNEQPYVARLKEQVWTVSGSLPRGHVGGVAVAEIAKRDGRILRVSHGL